MIYDISDFYTHKEQIINPVKEIMVDYLDPSKIKANFAVSEYLIIYVFTNRSSLKKSCNGI